MVTKNGQLGVSKLPVESYMLIHQRYPTLMININYKHNLNLFPTSIKVFSLLARWTFSILNELTWWARILMG